MNAITKLINETKTDPRFAAVTTVAVCTRCMRNIEAVEDQQSVNEYLSIGKSHIITAPFCPHCGLTVAPRRFCVN